MATADGKLKAACDALQGLGVEVVDEAVPGECADPAECAREALRWLQRARRSLLRRRTSSSSPPVHWLGPVGTSGYAAATRAYVRSLGCGFTPLSVHCGTLAEEGEVDAPPSLDRPAQLLVIHAPPDRLGGLYTAWKGCADTLWAMTVWETENLPPETVGGLRRFDRVLVPSEWNARTFGEAGLPHVDVLRHPVVAAPPSQPAAGTDLPADAFVVLCVGRLEPRKNLDCAVRAFKAAFGGDRRALLYLKTFVTYGSADRGAVARWLRSTTTDASNVVVDVQVRSQAEMDALYARADCYLSLAAAEGVGLGMAQAAQNRCPVVATMHGGQRDYLDGAALEVRYELVPVPVRYCGLGGCPGDVWAKPDEAHASELLRKVASERTRVEPPAGLRETDIAARFRTLAVMDWAMRQKSEAQNACTTCKQHDERRTNVNDCDSHVR